MIPIPAFELSKGRRILVETLNRMRDVVNDLAARFGGGGVFSMPELRFGAAVKGALFGTERAAKLAAVSDGADADVIVSAKGAGAVLLQANDVTALSARAAPGATEWVAATAGAAGQPARLTAEGSGEDHDLLLGGKGSGTLRLAVPIGGVTAASGFQATRVLVLKDAAGNVLYVPAAVAPW